MAEEGRKMAEGGEGRDMVYGMERGRRKAERERRGLAVGVEEGIEMAAKGESRRRTEANTVLNERSTPSSGLCSDPCSDRCSDLIAGSVFARECRAVVRALALRCSGAAPSNARAAARRSLRKKKNSLTRVEQRSSEQFAAHCGPACVAPMDAEISRRSTKIQTEELNVTKSI